MVASALSLDTLWLNGFCSNLSGLFTELREAALGIEHGAEVRIAEQAKALARAKDEEDYDVERHVLNWFTGAIPRVLRYSLVVSTLSVIESSLGAVCRQIHERLGLALSPRDLSGKGGIDRSRNYLVKVFEVDFGDLEPLSSRLKDWSQVRDCIVHANGEIERMQNPQAVREAVSRLPGLSADDESINLEIVIKIEPSACEDVIQLGRELIEAVMVKAFGPNPLPDVFAT